MTRATGWITRRAGAAHGHEQPITDHGRRLLDHPPRRQKRVGLNRRFASDPTTPLTTAAQPRILEAEYTNTNL